MTNAKGKCCCCCACESATKPNDNVETTPLPNLFKRKRSDEVQEPNKVQVASDGEDESVEIEFLSTNSEEMDDLDDLFPGEFPNVTNRTLSFGNERPEDEESLDPYDNTPPGYIPNISQRTILFGNEKTIEEENEYEDEIDEVTLRTVIPASDCSYHPTYTGLSSHESATEMMTSQTALSQSVSSVTSQDPNGIGWINSTQWSNAEWDGVPFDPTGKTNAEIFAFMFPNVNTMRGLRARFYEVNPYADVTNPTPREIEDWNLEVIRHARSLLGISTPVDHDKCLYLRARWGQERRFTTYWDSSYPGVNGSSYGPCAGSGNSHCGATFVPNASDQTPYANSSCGNVVECGTPSGSEGIIGQPADIPWSIKLARIIGTFVSSEGLGGHAGPFFNRTLFGSSWWYTGGGGVTFRGKWR